MSLAWKKQPFQRGVNREANQDWKACRDNDQAWCTKRFKLGSEPKRLWEDHQEANRAQ
jgi:hypothetical protein